MNTNRNKSDTMYNYPTDNTKIKGTISDSLIDIDEIFQHTHLQSFWF